MKIFRSALLGAFGVLILAPALLTGCKEPSENPEPEVSTGVVFEMVRNNVYIASLKEVSYIKVTLRGADGKDVVLPTLAVTGESELTRSTRAYALAPGAYTMVSYEAYRANGSLHYKADVLEHNEFTIEEGRLMTFRIPVKIRIIYERHHLLNALRALCEEGLGPDKSKWPWDFDNNMLYADDMVDWPYLDYEYDDYGNILYVSGLTLDGRRFPGWNDLEEFPEVFASLNTFENLAFIDLPNLKKLPSSMCEMMSMTNLTVINTGVSELPEGFCQAKAKGFTGITIVDSKLTEIPADITEMKDLMRFNFHGNLITKVDLPLSGLEKLNDVVLANNPLESIADGTFNPKGRINHLNLSGTKLASLPAEVKDMELLRGIDLTDCAFTSIPEQVAKSPYIRTVMLAGNRITSVGDLSAMTSLDCLYLDGNKLGTFPPMANVKMVEIGLSGCGLTAVPDLSGLTGLSSIYLGGNDFTSASLDFAANPGMVKISLAGSPKLTSLEIENVDVVDENDGRFSHVDVSECPSLEWKVPGVWDPYDFGGGSEGSVVLPGEDEPMAYGRVSVNRKGSPKVTFGPVD